MTEETTARQLTPHVGTKTSASKGLTPKRGKEINVANTAVVLLFIVFVLWQAGVFNMLGSAPPKSTPRFRTIVPTGVMGLKASTGALAADFRNTGIDAATIENLTVKHVDGKGCRIENRLPAVAEANAVFTIEAGDCASGSPRKGDTYELEVHITGTTTKRSDLYAKNVFALEQYAAKAPPNQLNRFNKSLAERTYTQEDSNTIVDFVSDGVLKGLYT